MADAFAKVHAKLLDDAREALRAKEFEHILLSVDRAAAEERCRRKMTGVQDLEAWARPMAGRPSQTPARSSREDFLRRAAAERQDGLFQDSLRHGHASTKQVSSQPRRPQSAGPRNHMPSAEQKIQMPWLSAEQARRAAWRRATEAAEASRRLAMIQPKIGLDGWTPSSSSFLKQAVEKDPADTPPAKPVLRCRLLGHSTAAALATGLSSWRRDFEAELAVLVAHVTALDFSEVFVKAFASSKDQQIVANISLGPRAGLKEARALEESLANGSLRNKALKEEGGLVQLPCLVLRQFLVRRVRFEEFWVVERYNWQLPSFTQNLLAQPPTSAIISPPFNLAGGKELTLNLTPRGLWRSGRFVPTSNLDTSRASLMLNGALTDLPRYPFLLVVGNHWVGPFGRKGSHFSFGGDVCSLGELLRCCDADGTLSVGIEAVQGVPLDSVNESTSEEYLRDAKEDLEQASAAEVKEPPMQQASHQLVENPQGTVILAELAKLQLTMETLCGGLHNATSAESVHTATISTTGGLCELPANSTGAESTEIILKAVMECKQSIQSIAAQVSAVEAAVSCLQAESHSKASAAQGAQDVKRGLIQTNPGSNIAQKVTSSVECYAQTDNEDLRDDHIVSLDIQLWDDRSSVGGLFSDYDASIAGPETQADDLIIGPGQ